MAQMEFPVIDLQATGRRIKEVREKKGITVKTLQMFLGFNEPVSIYKWQRGECLPTFDNMYAMACLFGVGIDDLLVGNRQEVVFLHFRLRGRREQPMGTGTSVPIGAIFARFCQNPQKGTGTSVPIGAIFRPFLPKPPKGVRYLRPLPPSPIKCLINVGSMLQLYLYVSINLS